MNPTQNPASESALIPTAQQRASARSYLAEYATVEDQETFALGYLRVSVRDAVALPGQLGQDALGRSLAMLLELDALQTAGR